MSDLYKEKYVKYKQKYLELKNSSESKQVGGMDLINKKLPKSSSLPQSNQIPNVDTVNIPTLQIESRDSKVTEHNPEDPVYALSQFLDSKDKFKINYLVISVPITDDQLYTILSKIEFKDDFKTASINCSQLTNEGLQCIFDLKFIHLHLYNYYDITNGSLSENGDYKKNLSSIKILILRDCKLDLRDISEYLSSLENLILNNFIISDINELESILAIESLTDIDLYGVKIPIDINTVNDLKKKYPRKNIEF
jgi:hypothetical protein